MSNLFDDDSDDYTPQQLMEREKADPNFQHEEKAIVSDSIMNAANAYGNLSYNFGSFASFF